MGQLYFGKQEEVRCIADVGGRGAAGEPLCVAYKTTTFFVGAGVHLRDDGYVLRARTGPTDRYYPLDATKVQEMQGAGELPTPMPPYSIALADYAWGNLLWLIAGMLMVSGAVRRAWRARRQRAQAMLEADPGGLPSLSVQTPADRFVRECAAALLRSGERVLQQAYVSDRDVSSAGLLGAVLARGLFAVLTTERVLLMSNGLALFGPTLRVGRVESIERSAIHNTRLDDLAIVLELADGTERRLVVPTREKALSGQAAFARDAARIAAPSPPASGVVA